MSAEDISCSLEGSSRNGSEHGAGRAAEDVHDNEERNISKVETKAVFRIKVAILILLVVASIAVAYCVFAFVDGSEISDFEQQFEENASKILEAVGLTLAITLGAVDSFAVDLVSYAHYSNSSWPFVTQPDFAIRGSKLRSITKSIAVSVYPLVTDDNRAEWEKYSVEHGASWVEDGLRVQETDESFEGLQISEWSSISSIYGNSGPYDYMQEREYLPTWLSAPVVPVYPPYNWDLAGSDDVQEAVAAVLNTNKVVFGKSLNVPETEDVDGDVEVDYSDWATQFIGVDEDGTEPYSATYYPILDSKLESVKLDNVRNATLVGVVAVSLFWRSLIEDILPNGSDGMVAVFGNDCNQAFTYQINGREAVFLGVGDRHNIQYDSLEVKSTFLGLNAISEGATKTYSGVPMNEEHCPYYLRVFPSNDMKILHTSKRPGFYTAATVLIFVFTSAIFLIYDCYVERRQRVVLRKAIQSSKVVSSLFPSTVRDRLYEHDTNTRKCRTPIGEWAVSRRTLKTFISGTESARNLKTFLDRTEAEHTSQLPSAPIAELFTDTTVMFADIAGFTAWSSARSPVQVFTLLETIYGAFDKIAKLRRVFKVETIGDSYVAVVGLPTARRNHAVVMARFARDCRTKMAQLTTDLAETLGEETATLSLRFGLNSGPVTAGVLRGEKARFQLFGDTVNTAARMESNGIKNRIHVSQSTADLIVGAGKGHWVEARNEKIHAKGKGELQTFWVEPNSNDFQSLGSSCGTVIEVDIEAEKSDVQEYLEKDAEYQADTKYSEVDGTGNLANKYLFI